MSLDISHVVILVVDHLLVGYPFLAAIVHFDVGHALLHDVIVHPYIGHNLHIEQEVEVHESVFFVIDLLLLHCIQLSLLHILAVLDLLEERLEVEPSVESLVLILRIYQFKEVFFVDILQLYVFLLLSLLRTRWYNSVPFEEAISGRI